MIDRELWERCVAFHGHECGGLMIGFQAAVLAAKLLKTGRADDEELVCISENDACGIDAIQVVLGCSVGKGNLLFHMRGKQAFSFYNRTNGTSVRLVLKQIDKKEMGESSLTYYQKIGPEAMFDVKGTTIPLPEPARIFDSYYCECCGEKTGANWIRLREGKKLCLDCYGSYDRFCV